MPPVNRTLYQIEWIKNTALALKEMLAPGWKIKTLDWTSAGQVLALEGPPGTKPSSTSRAAAALQA